jgi:hypothetical protein
MANEEVYTDILPLLQRQLESLQGSFGYLLGGAKKLADHAEAAAREKIQGEINEALQGLLIVYLFSMWEEYVPRELEREWLPEEVYQRLNAYRHIRHTVAHGFDGNRAKKCRVEFEMIMNSDYPFKGVFWDCDSLKIGQSDLAHECWNFMSNAAKQLIGRIANDNRP